MSGLLEAKIVEIRHMLSQYKVERARLRRVNNYPHKPECTLSGDMLRSERIEERDKHTIEVVECSECHQIKEYDQTERKANAMIISGLWH